MAGQEFKATEKSVLKNTRDGAVEKKLVSNTAERVSKRTEDAVLKKEVSPELLAQYKAAGIEKPTIPHRQFKNLQFGRNNPDKPRSDDERDNQQSEQTVMAFAPVVSINFAPKEVPDRDYTTRAVRSRRKAQTKADIAEQIANQPEKVVAEVVDMDTLSEGTPFDDNVEIVDAEIIDEVIASNKWAILIIVIFLIVFALLGTFGTSIATSLVDGGTQMVATTYTADDEDIYSAEGYLAGRESELRDYINNIPSYYVGWNEYNYYIDDIGHT